MRLLHASPALRGLALALLFCALAMRVIVLPGFMLGTTADGAPIVEICNGQGPMQVVAASAELAKALSNGHHKGQDDKAPDHPCAFASASALVDLAAVAHPVALHADASVAPVAPRFETLPGRGLAAPPPPKTGPPTFA